MGYISAVSNTEHYSYIEQTSDSFKAEVDKCLKDGSFYIESIGKIKLDGSIFIDTKESVN